MSSQENKLFMQVNNQMRYQMETKIKDHEEAYLHALVLAITAPNDALSQECVEMAESIGSHLTEKQRDLCKKGVEVCMEYLK